MDKITHKGIIERVDDGKVIVRIVQNSACGACRVAGHCSAAESKEKLVEAIAPSASNKYAKGDEVTVAMKGASGVKAVLIAFIFPFILMVAVIALLLALSCGENDAALCGVGILIPYYGIVYLLNNKLKRQFQFVLEDTLKLN